MKTKNPAAARKDTPEIDEAFDPWEQVRPIPLFLVAVVFALGLWGLLTYLSEHAAQYSASDKRADQARVAEASTGTTAGHAQNVLLPTAVAAAAGANHADAATLVIVQQGKGQAWSCASCHGEAGQGNLSTPRLAGQPAEYLKKQLQDFASGLRMNESMAVVAKALTEAEIDNVAKYYGQLEVRFATVPTLGGDLARGQQLAQKGDWKADVPACFSCHGLSGEGVAPAFPALAGQQPDYLFTQLTAWHAGERKNSPQGLMDGISQRMSVQDMRSVADYLGSLPLAAARNMNQARDAQEGAAAPAKKVSDAANRTAG